MTELISLSDSRRGESSIDKIEFDPIPITEDDEKDIWIQNQLSDRSVEITDVFVESVEGSGEISVEEQPDTIPAGEAGKVKLHAKAIETEQLSGISANMNVEAKAVFKP